MSRFAQGKFVPTQPAKYIGNKVPTYRSSWEWTFMKFCDTHPSVQRWACEAIKIPYKNPLTGRQTVDIADVFIQDLDKANRLIVELSEIKRSNQAVLEKVGGNETHQAQFIQNQAKWSAAQAWCKQQGIKFRVVTENELFHNGKA